MALIRLFTKYFFILGCIFLLTHCAKVSDPHLQVNQQLTSPYTLPASSYLDLAQHETGRERQALQLMAAGRLIYDGQWRQGRTILSRLKRLPLDLQNQKNLLMAKVFLTREQPKNTLSTLAKVRDITKLSLYDQVQYHTMLAQAYQLNHNAKDAVTERMKLDHLLPDKASIANNRRELWLTLTKLSKADLNTVAIEADDNSEIKGWMKLALVARKEYSQPHDRLEAIQNWEHHFPNHPANALISPTSVDALLFPKPKNIALMLPLSGPISGPGRAIRDGFMAAYHQNASHIKVKDYNTYNQDIENLYHQAIDDGADYVVGPLTKSNANKVATLNHPVPTLLLNDLSKQSKGNAYQFGLSPIHEARQVASKARRNGHTRTLVIAPTGAWGDSVVEAFNAQWQDNGGTVVDSLRYTNNESFGQPIRDFLHITASEDRKKALTSVLRKKIQFTPRRRQDFDMIFLLAYPSKARQIMPLLRYYYAGDVPVYATSSVYGGQVNAMKDRDLNGIIFCDMPWVFHHNMGRKNWPEQLNSYNRLYALGMDSFALSSQLNQLLLFPAMGVSDKSGILYLNGQGQVSRILAWGQFRQGKAVQSVG